ADLGARNNMILRNHGLLVCGRTVAETYVNLWCLEIACRMQVQTLSCGRALNLPSPQAVRNSEELNRAMRSGGVGDYAPTLGWEAARRLLDAAATDYRN